MRFQNGKVSKKIPFISAIDICIFEQYPKNIFGYLGWHIENLQIWLPKRIFKFRESRILLSLEYKYIQCHNRPFAKVYQELHRGTIIVTI